MKNEVVISGMAGMFPESANVEELKENLMKKINMVTTDERKWNKVDMDVPLPTGKMHENDAFDDMFFGIPTKHSEVLDQHVKLCLEVVFSALCDAGINPADIAGSDTAVMSCSCLSEPEYEKSLHFHAKSGALITGMNRGMQSNRISFNLNLRGPSYTIDSSWNACFEGIQYAYKRISSGTMKAAIITTCSLIYIPEASFHYKRMGRLNCDGLTKSFSNDADGYSRSEACVAFILQRKEDALRSYGSVLGVSDSFQADKNEYFPNVSPRQYLPVLKNFYDTLKIDPRSIAYLEGAGCASKIIDAEELNAVADVMLPGREEPLFIGCVKSNLGHCEASSDALALVKSIIAADSGVIPPNINYSSPNSLVPALVSGKLKVVTEPTPLQGELIGVNSISVVGSIKHLVLKQFNKKKAVEPEVRKLPPDGLPRLFYMTGRLQDKTEETLKMVQNMPIDDEFIALSNHVFKKGIKNHKYRGYSIISDNPQHDTLEINEFFTGQKTNQIWFVFTGMGSQWFGMGKALLQIPVFAKTIEKCHETLYPQGIDIYNIITTDDPKIFDDVFNSFVGIAAMQVGLVDLLYELGIYPDGIIGHSVGELGCAYADGALTIEQMIQCAVARGRASHEDKIPAGLMAAVGLGYNEIKDGLPEEIDVACHNSKHNCTISGPTEIVKQYVKSLQEKFIFARIVNTSNIAYHSRYIEHAAPVLLKSLKKVLPNPKLRSKKWICTSVPEAEWDTDLAKYCSAEFMTNNLLKSVLFEEASVHIPPDATVIEIAPHGLLQPILKQILPMGYHVPLTKRGHEHGVHYLLKALGRLYIRGHTIDIEKLYPPIEYPVSRGTKTLATLLNWDHSNVCRPSFFLLREFMKSDRKTAASNTLTIDLKESSDLRDYKLKGTPAIPFGAILEYVIQDLKRQKGSDFHLIQFKNAKMLKNIDIIDKCQLFSQFQLGSGNWQLCDGEEEVFNTEINILDSFTFPEVQIILHQNDPGSKFYEKLNQFGLNLGPAFRLIKQFGISKEDASATVLWEGKLTNFLEAVLQVPVLAYNDESVLMNVTRVSTITIDLSKFPIGETKEFNVYFNKINNQLYCDGLQINCPATAPIYIKSRKEFVFQEPQFVTYDSTNVKDLNSFLSLVLDIIFSNSCQGRFSNKDLELIVVGDDTNIYDGLQNIYQNVAGLNVFVKIFPEDKLLTVEEQKQYKSKNVLVVRTSPSTPKALELVEKCSQGFILIRDHSIPHGFEVIFNKQIGKHKYSLCKKGQNDIGECSFVSLSSKNWETELEYHLNTNSEKHVYLEGYATSISKMYYIIGKTSLFSNSQKLRYVFHDRKTEKFQPTLFKNQLVRGLRINILNQNKWVFIASKALDIEYLPPQIGSSSTFRFSQILSDDIQIKAIGLNPRDKASQNCQVGVIEYSGEENGVNICGIGSIDERTQQFKPDDILKWKKPMNWSHDEIVSIILPYSLAYCVVNLTIQRRKVEGLNYKTILVHCGNLPLSQAIINAAQAEGIEVFTTYKEESERQLIRKLFPKIPHENIVSCETMYFSDVILETTYGEGVDVIVSPLPNSQMNYANAQLVSEWGVIYQTTFEEDFDDSYFGMKVFMKAVSIYGLSPSTILLLSNKEKEAVQGIINNALISREKVKPLPVNNVTNQIDIFTANKLLNDPSFVNSRIVLSANGKSVGKPPLSLCEENAHYIILVPDKARTHLWINILEWLTNRIASNVHIIIDWSTQPQFICERFDCIKNRNPNVTINSLGGKLLKSPAKISQFVNSIKQTGKLAAVFITSQEQPDKIKSMNEVAGDALIVHFISKYEEIPEESGKNSLMLVDQDSLLDADILTSFADALVQLQNKFLILCDASKLNSTIADDNPWEAYNQHLPWTLKQVLTLSHGPEEFGWHEVRTRTTRLRENRGATPIFIIPPIIKGKLDNLVKKLFNPAFEAEIPTSCDSVNELVDGLFKKALKFKNNEFTLVCSDWSFSVGVQLGKTLESVGRKINIVFLQPMLDWDSSKVYQAIHQKVTGELECNKPPEYKKPLLQTALRVIQKRLEFIKTLSPDTKGRKLQGVVVLVKNNSNSPNVLAELSKHCENPVTVHSSEAKSYIEMLNSNETADVINQIAPVNYTDAATPLPTCFSKERVYLNSRHDILQRLVDDYIKTPKK